MATLIGSMPHTDPQEAVRLVMENLLEAPIWPELPRRPFLEGRVHSHTGGLPCLVVEAEAERLYVDTSRDCSSELAGFYEKAMAYPCVKTHCIGPVSFGLQLVDEQDKSLFYNETYRDVLTRQIILQSRWLIERFAPFGETVIAFLDEPSLAAFGSSSYIALSREQVIEQLGLAVAALKSAGAVVGVHVCGNTDWSMIAETGADLLNYDAYEFGPSMLLYPEEVGALLKRGGILAWGIVPNSEKVRSETAAALEERFFSLVDGLAAKGIDRQLILDQSMLTPACGMGPMSVADAGKVVDLLCELAEAVQGKVRS
jgi:hypothetical protein